MGVQSRGYQRLQRPPGAWTTDDPVNPTKLGPHVPAQRSRSQRRSAAALCLFAPPGRPATSGHRGPRPLQLPRGRRSGGGGGATPDPSWMTSGQRAGRPPHTHPRSCRLGPAGRLHGAGRGPVRRRRQRRPCRRRVTRSLLSSCCRTCRSRRRPTCPTRRCAPPALGREEE